MNRFNRSPSRDYRAFVENVREYARDDQQPGETVTRALAHALEEELRERFKTYWNVNDTADTACLRRIITGEEACNCDRSWIDREFERIGEGDEPPHSPPYDDHSTLWLDEGDPALYSMHISSPEIQLGSKTVGDESRRNGWFDIIRCAQHWGLEVGITPFSWYHAFSTINVVFYPPERSG